jgi:putative solute:sodium symporter small subunit
LRATPFVVRAQRAGARRDGVAQQVALRRVSGTSLLVSPSRTSLLFGRTPHTQLPPGIRMASRRTYSPADGAPSHSALYWRRNLRLLAVLLSIWFVVSFGAGILFAGLLNGIRIPGTGFPLGFWFAQQGSIYTFVILIFIYVWRMNRLDREFDVHEEESP